MAQLRIGYMKGVTLPPPPHPLSGREMTNRKGTNTNLENKMICWSYLVVLKGLTKSFQKPTPDDFD